jgi:hypothetical protein
MAEIQTTEYEGVEIRARGHEALFVRRPITVAATQTALETGTVMGQVTDTGLYVAYDDTKSDGREVAKGILANGVDPVGEGRAVPVSMYVAGRFIESKLTGIDAAAKADLGGSFQFE